MLSSEIDRALSYSWPSWDFPYVKIIIKYMRLTTKLPTKFYPTEALLCFAISQNIFFPLRVFLEREMFYLFK